MASRSIYVDPDTEDDLQTPSEDDSDYDVAPSAKRQRRTAPPRSVRSNPRTAPASSSTRTARRSTRAPVTPASSSQVFNSEVSRINARHGTKKPRPATSTRARVKAKASPVKADAAPSRIEFDGPTDGVIPPWANLPYEVLLSIFSFAYDDEPGSHTWLLKSACRTCRAFAEPALSAFYQTPRLPHETHAENLYNLVRRDLQEQHFMNYRVKVKALNMDVRMLTSHKESSDAFEASSLITELPQLEDLLIISQNDKPPYRRHTLPRWRYNTAFLSRLVLTDIRLKSWRWNWLLVRRAANAPKLYDFMIDTHRTPVFQSITHLEIGDHPQFVRADGAAYEEDQIAEAISLLPTLKSLELETCDIVNERFLERLPKSLARLRLANCEALTSDAIRAFVGQCGGCQLEELVLDHNVRLDLRFLPLLKSSCRNLKRLSMNLQYFSQHHTVNDAEARYKYLLGDHDIPTWPASLESVEFLHLQKWSAKAAQNLYQSLLDSAVELTQLRNLILHAHISISWRERATFRDEWIGQLRRTFLRRCKDPSTDLVSLKAWRMAKEMEQGIPYDGVPNIGRRFSSVSTHSVSASISSDRDEAVSASDRRSRRIAAAETERSKRKTRKASSRFVSFGSDEEGEDDSEDVPKPRAGFTSIQGLCHTVDIRIDNQRPREEQLNESHFLDSEPSGDEDWVEGEEMPDEEYAW